MKLLVNRSEIHIVPETELDKAYIEDTLGLRRAGDKIALERVAVMGLPAAIAYLSTVRL